jgi:hypothetical protein
MRLHDISHLYLTCPELDRSISAYQKLGLALHRQDQIDEATALQLGNAHWRNRRVAWLASGDRDAPWLALIDAPETIPSAPFQQRGWMALEILVDSVDLMLESITASSADFRVLQGPKDLDFSDAIRAMQVAGPSGEVLYLTEVKRTVAPFRLPISPRPTATSASAFAPFVAVLATGDREQSLAFYQGLGVDNHSSAILRFDTRLSAFNAEHGIALDQKHPVATAQLRGAALIEFDQVGAALSPALQSSATVSGIVCVAFRRIGTRGQAGPVRVLAGPDQEALMLC